jgi:hypothetical protein
MDSSVAEMPSARGWLAVPGRLLPHLRLDRTLAEVEVNDELVPSQPTATASQPE